jgi:hypothetical protein
MKERKGEERQRRQSDSNLLSRTGPTVSVSNPQRKSLLLAVLLLVQHCELWTFGAPVECSRAFLRGVDGAMWAWTNGLSARTSPFDTFTASISNPLLPHHAEIRSRVAFAHPAKQNEKT